MRLWGQLLKFNSEVGRFQSSFTIGLSQCQFIHAYVNYMGGGGT